MHSFSLLLSVRPAVSTKKTVSHIPGPGEHPAWSPCSQSGRKTGREAALRGEDGKFGFSLRRRPQTPQKRATESRIKGKGALTLAVRGAGAGSLGIFSLTVARKKFHKCLWHISAFSRSRAPRGGHPHTLQSREEPSEGGLGAAVRSQRARRDDQL